MAEKTHEAPKKSTPVNAVYVSIGILALVLIFLFFLLWRQYAYFQRTQGTQALRVQITRQAGQIGLLREKGPLPVADASYIQAWMTFDYIDMIFNIPSQYLKTALTITDIQYPRISISRYARENHLDSAVLVEQTVAAVGSYTASSSAVAE